VKRKFNFLLISALLCFSLTTAYAEEAPESPTEPIQSPAAIEEIMPVDIITNEDKTEIRKVYEIEPELADDVISREPFDHNGYSYTVFDILKEDLEITTSQLHEETVTVNSKSNDTATVLSLLEKTMEFTTEDGLSGVLYLDTDSIKTQVSGYGSSNYTVTATRSYPNLSDADMQYIPKTIQDNGRTLTFQNVQWQTDNTKNVDDYEIGTRYTAIVNYSGTATKSYVKGYTVTAKYSGEVSRTDLDKKRYTVIYTGTPVPEDDGLPAWTLWGIPIAALLLGGGGLALAGFLKKRSRKESYYEEEPDYEEDETCYDDFESDSDDDYGDNPDISS